MMQQHSGKLKIATPSDREIVITREFDAPRALVWEAMTKPELLRKWMFCPPGWEMTTCEEDVRVGGQFRWAWSMPTGGGMSMHGTYREVVPPGPNGAGGRIVRTETFDAGCASQSGEQVGTLALTESGGRTQLTLAVVYPSKAARDATLASGMDQGMSVGYDNLDEFLRSGR